MTAEVYGVPVVGSFVYSLRTKGMPPVIESLHIEVPENVAYLIEVEKCPVYLEVLETNRRKVEYEHE